jgi:hypothetical protein
MTDHSPLPWTAEGSALQSRGVTLAIFHRRGTFQPTSTDEANAQLVLRALAMSPTVQALTAHRDALLAALRDLADTNNDFSEALVRARSAIARATTGEKS